MEFAKGDGTVSEEEPEESGKGHLSRHIKVPKTEREYHILKVLMTGKYIKGTLEMGKVVEELKDYKQIPINSFSSYLREWEEKGIIIGYAPILSERGQQYFQALKTLYDSDKKDLDFLEEK